MNKVEDTDKPNSAGMAQSHSELDAELDAAPSFGHVKQVQTINPLSTNSTGRELYS